MGRIEYAYLGPDRGYADRRIAEANWAAACEAGREAGARHMRRIGSDGLHGAVYKALTIFGEGYRRSKRLGETRSAPYHLQKAERHRIAAGVVAWCLDPARDWIGGRRAKTEIREGRQARDAAVGRVARRLERRSGARPTDGAVSRALAARGVAVPPRTVRDVRVRIALRDERAALRGADAAFIDIVEHADAAGHLPCRFDLADVGAYVWGRHEVKASGRAHRAARLLKIAETASRLLPHLLVMVDGDFLLVVRAADWAVEGRRLRDLSLAGTPASEAQILARWEPPIRPVQVALSASRRRPYPHLGDHGAVPAGERSCGPVWGALEATVAAAALSLHEDPCWRRARPIVEALAPDDLPYLDVVLRAADRHAAQSERSYDEAWTSYVGRAPYMRSRSLTPVAAAVLRLLVDLVSGQEEIRRDADVDDRHGAWSARVATLLGDWTAGLGKAAGRRVAAVLDAWAAGGAHLLRAVERMCGSRAFWGGRPDQALFAACREKLVRWAGGEDRAHGRRGDPRGWVAHLDKVFPAPPPPAAPPPPPVASPPAFASPPPARVVVDWSGVDDANFEREYAWDEGYTEDPDAALEREYEACG